MNKPTPTITPNEKDEVIKQYLRIKAIDKAALDALTRIADRAEREPVKYFLGKRFI